MCCSLSRGYNFCKTVSFRFETKLWLWRVVTPEAGPRHFRWLQITCRTQSERPTLAEGLHLVASSLLLLELAPSDNPLLLNFWSEAATRARPSRFLRIGLFEEDARAVGQKQELSLSKSDRRVELRGGFASRLPPVFPLSPSALLRLRALPSRLPSPRPHTAPRAKSRRPCCTDMNAPTGGPASH